MAFRTYRSGNPKALVKVSDFLSLEVAGAQRQANKQDANHRLNRWTLRKYPNVCTHEMLPMSRRSIFSKSRYTLRCRPPDLNDHGSESVAAYDLCRQAPRAVLHHSRAGDDAAQVRLRRDDQGADRKSAAALDFTKCWPWPRAWPCPLRSENERAVASARNDAKCQKEPTRRQLETPFYSVPSLLSSGCHPNHPCCTKSPVDKNRLAVTGPDLQRLVYFLHFTNPRE